MTTDGTQLPNDLTLCHALIQQLHDTVHQSQRRIEKLEHQLAQLLRARYGPRAERVDDAQLMLFARDILQGRLDTVPDPQQNSDEPSRSPGKHRGRKPLPKDLPRIFITVFSLQMCTHFFHA